MTDNPDRLPTRAEVEVNWPLFGRTHRLWQFRLGFRLTVPSRAHHRRAGEPSCCARAPGSPALAPRAGRTWRGLALG